MNFNLTQVETSTLPELLNRLKTAEDSIRKEKGYVLMVEPSKERKFKSGPKKTIKKAFKPTDKIKKEKKPKGTCFHCGKDGHWKRNCKAYLESLKQKKLNEAFTSGMFMIEINLSTSKSDSWVLDIESGSHICINMQGLKKSRKLAKGEVDLRVGNGARVVALAVGIYTLSLPSGLILDLKDCYFVPTLTENIISISCLDLDGFTIITKNKSCSLYRADVFYGAGNLTNGLYILDLENPVFNIYTKQPKIDDLRNSYLWHCRLGHINEKRINKLYKNGYLGSFDYESFDTCESCLLGKMTKTPFTGKGERSTELLSLIHTDVCGPISTQARNGFSYFLTFTDDHSRYGHVYLLKYKSEVFEKFKEYKSEVENQLGQSIKILRSDRGGEYLSQEFQDYLKENVILSQWTPPYTPQLNGVFERRNRTLLDMVRSMMIHANLPKSFWGDALNTASYLLNHAPSKAVDSTPYEIWYKRKPNLKHLKVWGCPAFVKKVESDKLDSKSDKCYFVGYLKESFRYYFYNPNEQKVFVSRHATFLEREFILEMASSSQIELDEVREPQSRKEKEVEQELIPHDDAVELTTQDTQGDRRSSRIRRPPQRYDDVFIINNDEPTTYNEVLLDKDSEKWLQAMHSEMDSMYENEVWTLVDPPIGTKPIGCKWVFKKKTDMDGKVFTYKARLLAKGCSQKYGIDYDETFSPVAMLKSIRIILAIAAYYDYEIWQMDVKTAFLNGHLQEEVYMIQLEGFVSKDPNKVCKLQKSIYGLKQASRSWNILFNEIIKMFGFIKNEDEPCVYKKISGSIVVFLILYVDDILLIENDIPSLQSVKEWLSKNFSMKDLGEVAYIWELRSIVIDRISC